MKKNFLLFAFVALMATCAMAQTVKVDKWICRHSGELKGVVVDYGHQLDSASVAVDAFAVDGPEVTGCMVKGTRVILGLKHNHGGHHHDGKGSSAESGKETPVKEYPDVSVRQTRPIKTADGNTIEPWKKAIKAG